eukprot:3666808-Prymnesium_polylepis.1
MRGRFELAFRTLQGGLNVGKVVVRIAPHTFTPAAEGYHIVTGGTAGLGLLTARWLAQHGARRLALVSRGGVLAQDMHQQWEGILSSGAPVLVARCNTSDTRYVSQLIATVLSVTGIWHAAGALSDGLLPAQSAQTLSHVYAPKVMGAWSLQHACARDVITSFTLFSSVSALVGGTGQANYSAANTCLDSLSLLRLAHSKATVSVQWGAWAEIGMAARGSASERAVALEAASGFGRIGLAEGLRALADAVHSKKNVLAMFPVDWSRLLSGTSVPAFLSEFAQHTANCANASVCQQSKTQASSAPTS